MIGIRQLFQLIPQFSGREAENPWRCHEPSSFKGDASADHFIKSISAFLLGEFQSATQFFSLHLENFLREHFLGASLT